MTLADDRPVWHVLRRSTSTSKEVRGLLYAYDRLYANANGSQAMYRLRLTMMGGPKTSNCAQVSGHGRPWSERPDARTGWADLLDSWRCGGDPYGPLLDRTSPLRESRRGKPRQEGYLIRTDRDGHTGSSCVLGCVILMAWPSNRRRFVHLRRGQRIRYGYAMVSTDAHGATDVGRRLRIPGGQGLLAAGVSRPSR